MFTKNIGEDAGQTGCGRATDSFWVFMLKKKNSQCWTGGSEWPAEQHIPKVLPNLKDVN